MSSYIQNTFSLTSRYLLYHIHNTISNRSPSTCHRTVVLAYRVHVIVHMEHILSYIISKRSPSTCHRKYHHRNAILWKTTHDIYSAPYRTHSLFSQLLSPLRVLTSPSHNANVYRIRTQHTEHILYSYNIQNTFHIQPFLSPYITSPQRTCLQNTHTAYRTHSVPIQHTEHILYSALLEPLHHLTTTRMSTEYAYSKQNTFSFRAYIIYYILSLRRVLTPHHRNAEFDRIYTVGSVVEI